MSAIPSFQMRRRLFRVPSEISDPVVANRSKDFCGTSCTATTAAPRAIATTASLRPARTWVSVQGMTDRATTAVTRAPLELVSRIAKVPTTKYRRFNQRWNGLEAWDAMYQAIG